jgi:hypothetical protein
MEMYDVLLLQLYSELQPPNAEPLSIEVLASALERYCQRCRVKLLTVNPITNASALRELIMLVSASTCKLLGISVPQGTYPLAIELLSTLENTFSASKLPLVVLGHALPTYMPAAFLTRYPWTIVVKGWGEDALIEIVRMLQSSDLHLDYIPGIVYKIHDQIVSTPLKNEIFPLPPKRKRWKNTLRV